jgi:hypothetical protein
MHRVSVIVPTVGRRDDPRKVLVSLPRQSRLPGEVIIVREDVGSNVGQFLIAVAKIVGQGGQAVGFEPDPVNDQRLRGNVALNDLMNVKVFQMALGDCSGEIHIYGARGTATPQP